MLLPFPINRPFALCLAGLCLLASPAAHAQDSTDAELAEEAPAIPVTAPGAVPTGSVGGMGDVNLYPRRIVIDRRQRIASVGLYNRTANTGEYEISIVDMVMTPQGGIIPLTNLPEGVDAAGLQAASSMLRWSPRRVMLGSSEAQTVRIMVRPPEGLPDGEYRSHFMAISVPPETDQGLSIEEAVGVEGNGNIGVTIRPRFGISIPVIVRIGETTLAVALRDLALVRSDDGAAIAVKIARSGTRSAYGDIVVTAAGSDIPVAVARGVGVYPEIDERQMLINLSSAFDPALLRPGTVLTATFTDDDVAPGEILARQDFVVP